MTTFVPGGPPRYAHQRAGLRKLIETRGITALLMEPGCGKTAVVLDYASLLAIKSATGEARVLVVCPLAAIDTWVTQAETFVSPQVDFWAEALGGSITQRAQALTARGPGRHDRSTHHRRSQAWAARGGDGSFIPTPADGPDGLGSARARLVIEVVNLETFSSRSKVGSRLMSDVVLDAVKRFQPDLLVVDESHKIKGNGSNVSKLLARVGQHVPRRAILTGTVTPHGPLDVYGQLRFLDPTAFGTKLANGGRRNATWATFTGRYAVRGGYMGYEVVGYRNLDHMQEVMAQRAIVVSKAEALDLPPTTDAIVPVTLDAAEQAAYDAMKKSLAVALTSGSLATAPNKLTQMLRLRQITSGHLPDDSGAVQTIGSSKVDAIVSLVNDTLAGEKRVVVFAYFTHEVQALRAALATKGTDVLGITGATTQADRQAYRRRFGSNDPGRIILVAQIRTLNMAVNELVTASHAVFGSLSQQRDEYEQARARLDRPGQTRPVTFWHVVAPGTVDDVIRRSHRERTDLEQALLNHIRSVNEGA